MLVLERLLAVPWTDPDTRRRARLLNILLIGVGGLSLIGLLATITAGVVGAYTPEPGFSLYHATGGVLIGVVVIYLIGRYWSSQVASVLFLLFLTAVFALTDEPVEMTSGRTTFIFVIPIMMASVLLWPWASFVMAGLICLLFAIVEMFLLDVVPGVPTMLGFFAVAFVAWLAARSLERTLGDLRRTNLGLDQRVDERTKDLAVALAREHAEAGKNQAILSGIADGVIVFDNDGEAMVANPAIGRILEQPVEEIVGSDIEMLMADDVETGEQERVIELLADRETRRASAKFEWGDKTLSVSFAPVASALGEVTGTVAVFRDFTREAEIDRMKSDFVSIVSHELRTPLTSIQGYLDLLLMGASGPINKQQESFLKITKENAGRLHDLVSDLLDISRIESGGSELDVQVVSVARIVEHAADTLQNEFDERGLTLTLDISPDLPEVFADPSRLIQILTNLLSNAYKYTHEGGATVQARVTGGALQIDVIDTGVGISVEDQAKLFTRFFRAEDTEVRQQPGTGLGLNITKSLVEMHHGEIWVTSEPGKGTTFSFTLPLPAGLVDVAEEEEVEPAPPVLEPTPSPETLEISIPAGPWILVADDEVDVANLFQHQLERAGYRVSVVTQGSNVVKVARQLQPELITLDLLMDVDGLTVLQELKADPSTADIPVVIISVVPEPEKGIALGAADYLVKPLDKGELLRRVRRVMDRENGIARNKILVVDDEIDIVGWLKHFLTHYGYQVSEAYDGIQALEVVATDKPDLILLDMKMPRMDGRTTIRRLREQQDTRHIPIIVLSAQPVGDEAERTQMMDMGVRKFLRKPVTMEQLVAEVKKHLRSVASPEKESLGEPGSTQEVGATEE